MSFEFDWKQLDNPELIGILIHNINQLISNSLPKLPQSKDNLHNAASLQSSQPIDYATFAIDFTTLNPQILSIDFGSIAPKLSINHIDINAENLETASLTIAFEYNANIDAQENLHNANDQSASISVGINAQGNTITGKSFVDQLKLQHMNMMDSDKSAYVHLRIKLVRVQLQGEITIKTKLNQSPLEQLKKLVEAKLEDKNHQKLSTKKSDGNEADNHNNEQKPAENEAGSITIVLHNNPLKSFDIQSNLDGSIAAVALRSTLYSKLSQALIDAVNRPIVIPIPSKLIPH
jgi:hypothetical protein